MPKGKKKGADAEDDTVGKGVFLGRPTNNVKIGIVGLPNVGKSTLFNCMTKTQNAAAENFPFCTIEPNVAKVPVPDQRFQWLCNAYKPPSKVPAVLTVTDIAGLVKGASDGEGLGNNFLSNIQAVDAIYHVIRVFDDPPGETIVHVEDSVDPVRDLEIIHRELLLKDLNMINNRFEAEKKNVERGVGGKEAKAAHETVCRVKAHLDAGRDVRNGEWNAKDIETINTLGLITAKPMIYLANMSAKNYARKRNKYLPAVAEWVKARGNNEMILPVSCAYEEELLGTDEAGRQAIIAETKAKTGLPKVIKTGYHWLRLIHYFTCGTDEVRAWTIREGTLAPGAAGVIHTDFEKFFICADVMKYTELKEEADKAAKGGEVDFKAAEAAVKAQGKLKQEGKNYLVADGDIMHFKHNVTSGGKKGGK